MKPGRMVDYAVADRIGQRLHGGQHDFLPRPVAPHAARPQPVTQRLRRRSGIRQVAGQKKADPSGVVGVWVQRRRNHPARFFGPGRPAKQARAAGMHPATRPDFFPVCFGAGRPASLSVPSFP